MNTPSTEPQDLWLKLLERLETDGLLLPAQTDVIRRIHRGTGQSVDVLLLGAKLVSETVLQKYLQKLYGVNTVFDPFELPVDGACRMLELEEVQKLNALPQKLESGTLSVLMVPPIDPGQLEWLRARTQAYVVPLVTTPLRFRYLLEHCLDVPMDPAEKAIALKVLEGISGKRERFASPKNVLYDPMAGPVEDASDEDDPLALSSLPILDRTCEGLDVFREEMLSLIENDLPVFLEETTPPVVPEGDIETATGISARTLSAGWTPLDPGKIASMAAEVESREQIPTLFYHFGARAMRSVVLFTCTEGFAMGWTGAGLGVFPHRLEGIIVPEDKGTFISDIVEQTIFLGKVQPTVVNKRILQLMSADPEDILVGGTVLLKERPVMVVVCVLDDELAGPDELPILQELCNVCASIVLKLVRAKKAT